jgi:phosphohistidine phosphatase
MLTLVLLRHAKSSWADAAVSDYDRPLANRGLKAAPEVGAALARLDIRPDLVLCSGAKRTRETLALILPKLGSALEVICEDAIYMATPAALLARLRSVRDDAGTVPRTVMVVGHNPGLEHLAALLVGSGEEEALDRMADKFPTGAVAVIAFDAPSWSHIAPGTGKLLHFLTPKRLT